MSVFVDTSAFLLILDGDDPDHSKAVKIWNELQDQEETLITTNYILVESIALMQRRLSLAAVKLFHDRIVPVLQIEWLSPQQHGDVLNSLLIANQRHLSFVDCASFLTMNRLGITKAFVFDKHFRNQGFTCIP